MENAQIIYKFDNPPAVHNRDSQKLESESLFGIYLVENYTKNRQTVSFGEVCGHD